MPRAESFHPRPICITQNYRHLVIVDVLGWLFLALANVREPATPALSFSRLLASAGYAKDGTQEHCMRSNIRNGELQAKNPASREKTGSAGSLVAPEQDPDTPESGIHGKASQDVTFTIVDDPRNESIYKGAGSYAATRAENAVHALEKAFPPLRFALRFERNLTALHVQAQVPSSVDNEAFVAALSGALASTGTRLAPLVGELCKDSPVTSGRRA